jgi:hypothetical protein
LPSSRALAHTKGKLHFFVKPLKRKRLANLKEKDLYMDAFEM